MRSNIYDDVKVIGGTSIVPQAISGSSEVDGSSVDTLGADNAAIYVYGVTAAGSPSAATLAVKVQESADGSTNWTDALDNTGTAIGFSLNVHSADAENAARIEGLGLNRKRYLRAVITPAFTSGSSPDSVAFAQIILGNNSPLPADTDVSNT